MARVVKPLTDAQIKSAKPKDREYKLFDGGGLYIAVTPKGYKWWRFKYKIDGKDALMSLGVYPETSLSRARDERQRVRALLLDGINPQHKDKSAKTFHDVAMEWYEVNKNQYVDSYQETVMSYLKNYAFKAFGQTSINKITKEEIVTLGKEIESLGYLETLKKTLGVINRVFRFAVSSNYTDFNPALNIDKGTIFKKHVKKNYPVITDDKKLGELLRAIDNYHGHTVTKHALRLAPHVFLRPFNIRYAEWSEIDFEKKIWRIEASKMKMKASHITPLSSQVIEILRSIQAITGDGKYVFPSPTSNARPISEGTLVQALRRLDYAKEEIVAHSFRGIASTVLNENISVHGIHTDAIERQLAHGEPNEVKSAYNHAKYLADRIKLMQWWSDYLDSVKNT
jgi:integrase